MIMKIVKSRKHHRLIKVDEDGNFICPVQKNRPYVCLAICFGRQAKRFRGCTRCRIPQKVQRKK